MRAARPRGRDKELPRISNRKQSSQILSSRTGVCRGGLAWTATCDHRIRTWQHTEQFTLNCYDQISVINTNLGAEEDDAVGPEESSFVEENVETEVRGDRDQAEDEGDQEEDAWGTSEDESEGIIATFTCSVIHTKRTKHLLDNLSVEEP